MRGKLARSFVPVAALALGLAAAPLAGAAAQVHDPVPISPNVYFEGLVNGHPPGQAIIAVACPVGASSGRPAPHQTIEVEPTSPAAANRDVGYTGSRGKSINATLSPSATATPLAHFTSFYVQKPIPTNITVPCSGTGTIDFTPAPGSPTARTAVLSVTFGNITTG